MTELLGNTHYEAPRSYSVEPVKWKSTVKSRKLTKAQNLPPVLCKNKDQLEDYMKHCVDGRRIAFSNDLKSYYEECVLFAHHNNESPYMKKPQYKIMKELIKLIRYQNIVLVTYDEMAKALDCHKKSINSKMKIVSDFIKREEDGLKRGMIKLYIHPSLAYKFESNWIEAKKEQAKQDWYLP